MMNENYDGFVSLVLYLQQNGHDFATASPMKTTLYTLLTIYFKTRSANAVNGQWVCKWVLLFTNLKAQGFPSSNASKTYCHKISNSNSYLQVEARAH